MEKMIIRKVQHNKANNIKLITIPKSSNIEKGDYVYVKKVEQQ